MSKPIQLFWPAFKSVSLVTSYSNAVAGPVRFNEVSYESSTYGGLLPQGDGALSQNGGWQFKGFQTPLRLSSGVNLSGTNFRIEGTDLFGNFVGENIAGPNATEESTTHQYATITSIVANGAVSDFTVWNDDTGRTAYIFADYNRSNWSASVQVECHSSLVFSVYGTLEPLLSNQRALTLHTEAKIIDASGKSYYFDTLASPYTAIWAEITSGGAAGRTLALTFLQQGLRS